MNFRVEYFFSWPGGSNESEHLVVTSRNYVSVVNSLGRSNKPVNSVEWKPSAEDEDRCRQSMKADCNSNHVVFALKYSKKAIVTCGVSASKPS